MDNSWVFLWEAEGTSWLSHPFPFSLWTCFPPHPTWPPRYEVKVLGYNLLQAMRFAVEEINNHSSLLPGVLLGYEMVDVCYISNNVQPVLYFLAQENYSLPTQEDYSHYVPRVVAVIGPDNSESTTTVAHFLSLFLLPQVRPQAPGRSSWGGRRGVVVQRAHFPPLVMGVGGGRKQGRDVNPSSGKAAWLMG